MSIAQWNLWKFGFFKGVGSLFSSQPRIQKCVFISETGVISLENLVLATGYCVDQVEKQAWMVIQKLKMHMDGVEPLVLPISERSFMPLDPLKRLTPDEIKKLEPLRNIARAKHAEVMSRVSDEQKHNTNTQLLITGICCLSLMVLAVLIIGVFKKS